MDRRRKPLNKAGDGSGGNGGDVFAIQEEMSALRLCCDGEFSASWNISASGALLPPGVARGCAVAYLGFVFFLS